MRRKLETNPLRYTDVERSILIDLRARSRAGLPIPVGYTIRADGTLVPHHKPLATEEKP